ncbi:MAG: Unknown protein [uncultured Sulfurovum sp.]|uniref:ATPase AAA-type core domain-containing protein n=1 Tax=uncultured Sulfurovum sp. TaxID=269237 RepID=A0A6S6TN90_9BACT|nr:MAG: Unknown protein [uncultured Sulfurovum sp.]
MSEHFVREIEIKNFKCFQDFKAEGFGRVNLIGGKNNVGKTAFMEACYLSQASSPTKLYTKLLEIDTHRDVINNLLFLPKNREEAFRKLVRKYTKLSISLNIEAEEPNNPEHKYPIGLVEIKENSQKGNVHIYTKYDMRHQGDQESMHYSYSDLVMRLDFNIKNARYQFSKNFISSYSNSNRELETIIGDSKLNDNKYETLNKHLLEVFNVTSIDIIKNKPMIKSDGKYKELSQLGQGIKTFINIIASILLLKDDFIFIDEIENGIHYTNLDKLWEIILTISKEANVQVFATTHSKECIESYARVAKKLEDEEITFIELGRNKENKLDSTVMDSEMFQRFIALGNEVRGW